MTHNRLLLMLFCYLCLLCACGGGSMTGPRTPTLAITSSNPPAGAALTPYAGDGFALTASGGQAPYHWSWVAATGFSLPAGLTISPEGSDLRDSASCGNVQSSSHGRRLRFSFFPGQRKLSDCRRRSAAPCDLTRSATQRYCRRRIRAVDHRISQLRLESSSRMAPSMQSLQFACGVLDSAAVCARNVPYSLPADRSYFSWLHVHSVRRGTALYVDRIRPPGQTEARSKHRAAYWEPIYGWGLQRYRHSD